jgi:hypothetical protein
VCEVANTGELSVGGVALESDFLADLPKIDQIKPGQTYVFAKQVKPLASHDYTVRATAKDSAGGSLNCQSNAVTVAVEGSPDIDIAGFYYISGVLENLISLEIETDTSKLAGQGEVTFGIKVHNYDQRLYKVIISEKAEGNIEQMDNLAVGDKLFLHSTKVTQSKTFEFYLEAQTQDGKAVVAAATPITITTQGKSGESPSVSLPGLYSSDGQSEAASGIVLKGSGADTALLIRLLFVLGLLVSLCLAVIAFLQIRDHAGVRVRRNTRG